MPLNTQPAMPPNQRACPLYQTQTISLARLYFHWYLGASVLSSSGSPFRSQSHSPALQFGADPSRRASISLELEWRTSRGHRRRCQCRVRCDGRGSKWRLGVLVSFFGRREVVRGKLLTLGCELVLEADIESGVRVRSKCHTCLSYNVFRPAVLIAYCIFNLVKVNIWYKLLA